MYLKDSEPRNRSISQLVHTLHFAICGAQLPSWVGLHHVHTKSKTRKPITNCMCEVRRLQLLVVLAVQSCSIMVEFMIYEYLHQLLCVGCTVWLRIVP